MINFFLAIGVVTVVLAVVFALTRKKSESPENKIEKIIEKQNERLARAQMNLRTTGEHIRQLKRDRAQIAADITTLKYRIKEALERSDEALAQKWTGNLISREKEIIGLDEKIATATADYTDDLRVTEEFRSEITKIRREARELSLRAATAENKKAMAAFVADLENGLDRSGFEKARSEIKESILASEAAVKVEDMCRTRDSEFQQPDVQSRLEQLRNEMKG